MRNMIIWFRALTLGGKLFVLCCSTIANAATAVRKRKTKIVSRLPTNLFIFIWLLQLIHGIRQRRPLLPCAIRASKINVIANQNISSLDVRRERERAQISCRLVIIKCCKTQWVPVISRTTIAATGRANVKRHEKCMMRERMNGARNGKPTKRTEEKKYSYMKYRFVADKNRSFSANAATTAAVTEDKIAATAGQWNTRPLIIYHMDDVPSELH